MTTYNALKLLHILSAIAFAGGIFSRQVVRAYAKQTTDVVWFSTLSRGASRIENVLIKPGSLVVLALGLYQAHLGGLPVLGALTGGADNWLLTSLLLYLSAFALVPLVFVPKGRAFRPILERALAEGRITDELRIAMNDPVVAFAHRYEMVSIVVVIALMVLKPF